MKETWPEPLYPSWVVSCLEVCSTELKRSVSSYTELIYLNLNFRLKLMVSQYKLLYCSFGSAFPIVLVSLYRELDLGAKLARHWCSRERNECFWRYSHFFLVRLIPASDSPDCTGTWTCALMQSVAQGPGGAGRAAEIMAAWFTQVLSPTWRMHLCVWLEEFVSAFCAVLLLVHSVLLISGGL